MVALWKSESIRFYATGAVGGAVYYAVFYLLSDLFGHAGYLLWGLVGSAANYTLNFFFQTRVTFDQRPEEAEAHQILKLVALFTALTLINEVLLYGLTDSLRSFCGAIHCPEGYARWFYAATPLVAGAGVMYANRVLASRIFAKKPRTPTHE